MRVWRVAHTTSRNELLDFPAGPYVDRYLLPAAAQIVSDELLSAHENSRHPGPYQDPALGNPATWEVCGFDSAAALRAWFEPEWCDRLADAGFQIWVYDVPESRARTGKFGQTLFFCGFATLAHTEPLGGSHD
jgi:hypothetical protein